MLIITIRNNKSILNITITIKLKGVLSGTGKPGNCPPEIFANMMLFVLHMKRFFSKLCYLYVNFFSRQPFCIRMCCVILDKTIKQSMHHASENSKHRTGDKL